jgi:hypothetical protein
MGGDRHAAVDDQECRAVGDGGRGEAAALLQVQAAQVAVAGAVGEGYEAGARSVESLERVGGALGEVDDDHRPVYSLA